MKQLFVRGFQFAALITCLAVSVAILTFVTGCNDSAVTEIEVDNQQSYDTPEAYLKAIAKAQTNLFTHASSAIREMDEKEFEKVMFNMEKAMDNVEVLQNSPVFDLTLQGDSEVKKFSEEDYRSWESNRSNYLDAFSPILSMEYLMEIETLMTEFATVYGTADIDTTGWRAIMQQASQDAIVYESGSCSSSQQITVNQASVWPMASILPMPSITNIMGRFQGSESQAACQSCCIECCRCVANCDQIGWDGLGQSLMNGLLFGSGCLAYTWFVGPISWGGCAFGSLVTLEVTLTVALYNTFRCLGKCKGRSDCQACPAAYSEYSSGIDCSTAPNW
ncbi:MAG: hypothetical protein OXG94_03430 [Bacteroidetes bacterium]|nr:hypothetical protein [Bacteroidota bacterium]